MHILDFTDRKALITGAASGIGAAGARLLANGGAATLILTDRDADALDAFDPGCSVVRIAGDVADPGHWDEVAPHLDGLDHAIVNAGIAAGGAIGETGFAEWRRVLGTNLDGAFLTLSTALPLMREGGSVVLTASVSGIKAEPGTAAYGCSKAGLIHLARVAAKEAAPRRIRVNAIAPGGVDTPIWDQTPFFRDLVAEHGGARTAALDAMAAMATPLGRYASADEIAAQVGFLLSDMAATITGAVLVSDGGYSL
ncbi:SDR family NAD(P)-dependent oxidoreductase [Qipengyuania spongiae]|uniref:SDR family oxidoreductase n=1 Tax=Qipengyuania spongiae TaxID=2909673 RepID=A0ABY5T086_9SPHN|nr:SDR family oxidoreductase [Qipengyuania spongiae]UVI38344.1 SDR family oxidoreductase [Qipengyuania spongiae]